MQRLDGNAIAGALYDVFGAEMTAAVGSCAECGWASALAEVMVYAVQPGVVGRCARCDSIVIVVVERHGVACVDLSGFASLEPARRSAPA